MKQSQIEIRLLRNATIIIHFEGISFLLDPMLSDKGELDPIPWSNELRNPLVSLPVSIEELMHIINKVDVVLITHLHPDHWDERAAKLIPSGKSIICQPEDEFILQQQGFLRLKTDVYTTVGPVKITRVTAQHGHGELGKKMAPASGYILQANEQTIYITGDTVWCDEIHTHLKTFQPDLIIANSGAAKFNFGEPITLTINDVLAIAENSKSEALIAVVHMEAVNHCTVTRDELRKEIAGHELRQKILIPENGESMIVPLIGNLL